MKILHILATPRAEGTPNLVLDWLDTGNEEQEVFVLHSEPADLTEQLQRSAGWYGDADFFFHGRRKFTDIALGVYRVCRERKPDLVICWIAGFGNWVCLGAWFAGVKKMLVHAGNPPTQGPKGRWMSRFVLWPVALLGAKVICCSDYVRSQFRSIALIPKSLFHTVWNCTRAAAVIKRSDEARAQRSPTDRCPSAIMVATLERHKDHTTLLLAVPMIRETLPDFRLLLTGDGTLRNELEKAAADLGVQDAVVFLGMRRDVPELLGQSDLFLFSTTPDEGLGSVLLEAMAAGLPILASDVPACRELLGNGKYGTLVPPKNPRAFADAVIQQMKSGQDESILKEAQTFALSFTAEHMMKQYLAITETRKTT